MGDAYPAGTSIPDHYLVPPVSQPVYTDVPGSPVEDTANAGVELSDRQVAAGRGDATALIHHESGRRWTYNDLSSGSNRLASALLGLGLRLGDRVAIRSPNRPEALVAALAIWKAGGVVVPTPAQAKGSELCYFLADVEARLLIANADDPEPEHVAMAVDAGLVEQVVVHGPGEESSPYTSWSQLVESRPADFAVPDRSSDHVALVWHTGGTTGRPKACYHTHRRFLLAGHATGQATGVRPGEVWAAAAPIGHALGFIFHTNYTLLHGATAVLIERYSDANVIAEAIQRHRVGTFTAVAIAWSRLATALERDPALDVSSLYRAYAMWQTSGSSPIRDQWQARGLELMNNFGSTAFAGWVLAARPGQDVEPASLGRPSPGYTALAVEPDTALGVRPAPEGTVGRLAVRGPSGLTYWRRPELQRRDVVDGWTLADDLIRYEPSGNATYLGRTDFVISTAGYKVVPAEVEAALGSHPGVREVCVVGAPDPERQEVVTAYVVTAPGYPPSPVLVSELQSHVKGAISPYKYPRRIEFVTALPRDHVGKLQTRTVQEWARKGTSP
ncbi:acyl-CoA synthetase [Streptomyces albipurpureus]|uniref:Acyl--CoA ligase n=1 Tax=Streptomyces albipurpureus TaxID=2897419 RepID=A0ABT0V088_9ACTN|nr:class I adenylate-forming enzyme family protein [Streptomyces sp. CWNU-1]MCM2393740.1 acyl--CoA ligase [Streptomyces sp. CWNU-1]